MRKYDYSFLKKNVPGSIMGLTGIVADLKRKEEFRKLQYAEAFESLQKKAIIESVKCSNAIEGIVTTDSRVRDIVAGAAPVTHEEQEISGYKNALKLIYSEYENLDIAEDTVCMFHRMLTEHTNASSAGNYKKNNNFIMEYNEDGSRRVRFKPVNAKDTPSAMEQMILAFYEARQDAEIEPLLLIPCFIVDFLCIHPFDDGNGRVSRLLTVLMLYSFGYDIVRYISFENRIEKYKDNYYAALEQASLGWHEGINDYFPFVIYFLQILYRCFKDLDDSFMEISLNKAKKSERVESILLSAIVPVSKQDIADKVPDISIKTVELVLSKMLKQDRIIKIGSYRNARYMRKNN